MLMMRHSKNGGITNEHELSGGVAAIVGGKVDVAGQAPTEGSPSAADHPGVLLAGMSPMLSFTVPDCYH